MVLPESVQCLVPQKHTFYLAKALLLMDESIDIDDQKQCFRKVKAMLLQKRGIKTEKPEACN